LNKNKGKYILRKEGAALVVLIFVDFLLSLLGHCKHISKVFAVWALPKFCKFLNLKS